jgi:phosphonate transport system ATP-binding protein
MSVSDSRKVSAGSTAVELRDVRCERGGVGGRSVLHIERLHIAAGERVALIGPNGAGKSTLLRVLSGFVTPSAGRVCVLGRELPMHHAAELRALRTDIAQVLQGIHLVARLSARDNVLIGSLGRRRGWRTWLRYPAPADIARAHAALAQVGMSERADTRADALSGGERQKIAMARLLMQDAALILADEPTAALDPNAAREACEWLLAAAQSPTHQRVTLVSVVHSPALLPLLAERVIGLRAGRVVLDAPLAQVSEAQLARLYGEVTSRSDLSTSSR